MLKYLLGLMKFLKQIGFDCSAEEKLSLTLTLALAEVMGKGRALELMGFVAALAVKAVSFSLFQTCQQRPPHNSLILVGRLRVTGLYSVKNVSIATP